MIKQEGCQVLNGVHVIVETGKIKDVDLAFGWHFKTGPLLYVDFVNSEGNV